MRALAREFAHRLVDEVAGPLSVGRLVPDVANVSAEKDWAASGAMELTGYPLGPPLPSPGAPASAVRAALAVFAAYSGVTATAIPGVEILSERADSAGLRRNAPFSPGGAFRALPARDGWLGISLARPADFELLPALTEGEIGADPWAALEKWLATVSIDQASARTRLVGLAAAAIPAVPQAPRRPGVCVTLGGYRKARDQGRVGVRSAVGGIGRARGRPIASIPRLVGSVRPVVADLTSLWAGPLCARLLGLAGARVIKIESRQRPDGARRGTPAFFDLMHAGHEFIMLDFASQRDELADLLRRADVVLEASRPRALQQLGIDAMEHVADGTVWVSITAYGRVGADAMRVGFGDDVAAAAGLVAWADGQPIPVGDAIADPIAGAHAAAAAAIALHGERGCLLDVSMHDVASRAAVPPEIRMSFGLSWPRRHRFSRALILFSVSWGRRRWR